MKVVKIVFGLIIAYFIMTATNSMIYLARWGSFGNKEIEYLIYALFLILFLMYVIFPLFKYYKKPSLDDLKEYIADDKQKRKMQKYFLKILNDEEFTKYDLSSDKKKWIQEYLVLKTDSFDSIIKKYAQQATITVMISPNSFIDGIAILFSNSKMIYELYKIVGFRYSIKDLFKMYFSVLTAASITGLVEEYDEVIEDIIEDLAEEFTEIIAEETGKSISSSVPVMKILVGSISPILQGAGNYAFILYSGHRFKYSLLNVIENTGLSEKDIKKNSRRRARSMKYSYVKEMSSSVMTGSGKKLAEKVVKSVKKINVFTKKNSK